MKKFWNKETLKWVFSIDFMFFAGTGWGYDGAGVRKTDHYFATLVSALLPWAMGLFAIAFLPMLPGLNFNGSPFAVLFSVVWGMAQGMFYFFPIGIVLSIPVRWLIFRVFAQRIYSLARTVGYLMGEVWNRIPDDPYSSKKKKKREVARTVQGMEVVEEIEGSEAVQDDHSPFVEHLRK